LQSVRERVRSSCCGRALRALQRELRCAWFCPSVETDDCQTMGSLFFRRCSEQSAVLIALRRVFSSCSSGWLVGSEVVGCWAESLANQQRIAKGPGSKDWDPGPAKRAPHPKGTANQTEEEEKKRRRGTERANARKRNQEIAIWWKVFICVTCFYAAWAAKFAAPVMAFWVMSPIAW
jgi:hypothetical protein